MDTAIEMDTESWRKFTIIEAQRLIDFLELGKSVLKNERDFNTRAGLTAEQDRLPEFFHKEPLPPHNITFQVTDEDLDQVFNF